MFDALDVLSVEYISSLPRSAEDISGEDVEYFLHRLRNGKEEKGIVKFYLKHHPKLSGDQDTDEGLAALYTNGLRMLARLIRSSDESLGLASLLQENGRVRFPKAMETLCSRTLVDADIQKFFKDRALEDSIVKRDKKIKYRSPLSPSSGGSQIGNARRRWYMRRKHVKRSLGEPVLDRILPPSTQAVLIARNRLLLEGLRWYMSTRASRAERLKALLLETDVVDRWSRRSNNTDERPGRRLGSRRASKLRAELRRMQAFRMSIGQFGGHLAGYAALCMRQPFSRSSSACLDAFEYCMAVAKRKEMNGEEEADPAELPEALLAAPSSPGPVRHRDARSLRVHNGKAAVGGAARRRVCCRQKLSAGKKRPPARLAVPHAPFGASSRRGRSCCAAAEKRTAVELGDADIR